MYVGAFFCEMRLSIMRSAAILGVVAASLLAPQPVSAALLDFTFEFSDIINPSLSVSGIIRGLEEGKTTAPEFVEVTSSSIGGIGEYLRTSGRGFAVMNGQITRIPFESPTFRGSRGIGLDYLDFFEFPAVGTSATLFINGGPPFGEYVSVCEDPLLPLNCRGTVTFLPLVPVPSTSVPGPLPVLGAAAAFGFSRKLRNRIKSSKLPTARTID